MTEHNTGMQISVMLAVPDAPASSGGCFGEVCNFNAHRCH